MVSTRQSSNVGGGVDGSNSDSQSSSGWNKPIKVLTNFYDGASSSSATVSSSSKSLKLAGSSFDGSASCSKSLKVVGTCDAVATYSGLSSFSTSSYDPPLNLLDMPPEILEKIFGYLGYQTVSHLRVVCKQLDQVCSNILNSTFQRLQNLMLNRFQAIRSKMPRRESARRHHPLALESDIIETLHMRLTLLQMTFGKHIERKHCCFFAGEILDEVYRILLYIKVTPKLARPYKVTDELFDLSTMAMEYFKEHIEPTLPEISCFGTEFLDFSSSFKAHSSKDDNSNQELPTPAEDGLMEPSVPQSNMVLRKRIRKIKQGMKRYNNQLGVMRQDLRNCKSKINEQQKLLLEYATRLDENDKKSEETSRKFSTLLQELNKCKTELQFWRSKAPANPPLCQSCGNSIPIVAGEDLQALANQGVLEGLVASPAPVDGDPFHFLFESEQVARKEEPIAGQGSNQASDLAGSSVNSITFPTTVESAEQLTGSQSVPEVQVPIAPKLGTKRKSSVEDTGSSSGLKLRRAAQTKSRTSKRASKV